MNTPKILCYVNHYYNPQGRFDGKSSGEDAESRKNIVYDTLRALKQIENITIKICGIEGFALVDIDIQFNRLNDSRTLIFASLVEMTKHIDEYDYYINIEDDILINNNVMENIYQFDKHSSLTEVFLPNRLEKIGTHYYCIDTKVFPGWINTERQYNGNLLKVAINPHSGILILNNSKMKYCASNIDLSSYEKTIGGPMASSFAHFHKPFILFRSRNDIMFHYVTHLDNWAPKKNTLKNRFTISNIKRYIRVIPKRLKFHIEEIDGSCKIHEKFSIK